MYKVLTPHSTAESTDEHQFNGDWEHEEYTEEPTYPKAKNSSSSAFILTYNQVTVYNCR